MIGLFFIVCLMFLLVLISQQDKIDRLSLRLQDLSARLDLLVKQVREQQS